MVPVLLLAGLFMLILIYGCGLVRESGVILSVSSSPNPSTGTLSADGKDKTWQFTLTFQNGASMDTVLVYAGTYEMKNTSNAVVNSGELPFNSFNIGPGGTYQQTWTFHSGTVNNHPKLTAGTIRMTFTGKTTGDPFQSFVVENIQ